MMNATSEHFNGTIFLNPVPTDVMTKDAFLRVTKKLFTSHPNREPKEPLGPFYTDSTLLNNLPPDTLRVTWLGHSSTILEIDRKRFLTDPVWYKRVSPFTNIGPKRFFENPISLDDLPPIDYILLSHDHYDHLDKTAVVHLTAKGIPVLTMLKVGKHLEKWGIDKSLITELDWWESVNIGDGFTVTAAPARHFSGRWIGDRFKTLWGSFGVKGPKHNVYYGADSGYFDGFTTIGEKLGPFDLTLLEIGAYNKEWEAIHMGPEGAVNAFEKLKGGLLMPIHWGTFNLAFHPWKEPVEWLIKEAQKGGIPLLLPAPGETLTISDIVAYNSEWWKNFE